MTEPEQAVDIRALRMQMNAYRGATKSISHRESLSARPHEVYETLLDSKRHSELTGAPATIDRHLGGPFSLYGGYATGFVAELLDDKHIVLAWRPADDRWPPDHFSTATFMLRPEANGGTTLVFFQQGVPEELQKDVADGWQTSYWEKLQAALG